MPAKKSATRSDRVDKASVVGEAMAAASAAAEAARVVPIVVTARRPDDLMIADIRLTNLKVVPGANPILTRRESGQHASMVLQLPPQSFGEEALLDSTLPEVNADASADFPNADGKQTFEQNAQTAPAPGATRIRMSGPSRLAFTMPLNVSSIPFTLEAILAACRTWPARRALTALHAPTALAGGAMNGSVAFLKGAVASAEFDVMRRTVATALEDLGVPAASAPIAAAGDALVPTILTAMRGTDDVAGERAVAQRLSTLVDAIVASFPALGRDSRTRALVETGIGYEATAGLAMSAEASRPGVVGHRVPMLSALFAPYRPGQDITAIEMPYRLVLSPVGEIVWNHATSSVAKQGRHELWHTRLDRGGNLGATERQADVRAIWTEDYGRSDLAVLVNEQRPFRMPLDPLDRDLLVRLSAGFKEKLDGGDPYTPRPLISRRLILTALGGSLDAAGTWTQRPGGIDLEQWQHRMSLGRDHYVRVVYAGFLMPFGHAASLIKVTERKFEPVDAQFPLRRRVARLRQRFFIVVRETVKTFDGSRHMSGGHAFPFTSVELLTSVTPNLSAPDEVGCRVSQAGGVLYATSSAPDLLTHREAFWPMVNEGLENFRFSLAATDRDGRRTTFALPLMFVAGRANTASRTVGAQNVKFSDSLRAGYNVEADLRRQANIGGESICYAPPSADAMGDPRLPTATLRFAAGRVASDSTSQLNAYPEVESAYVALRAVQRILGRDDATVHVEYDPIYATQGFGPGNTGELFLALTSQNPSWDVSFGPSSNASRTDAVGAIASPSMQIKGVSRRIGMASDLGAVQSNTFTPSSFFKDARILGGIKLEEIIEQVTTGLSGPNVPKFVTRDLPATGGAPARTEARYDWNTVMGRPDALGILIPRADGATASAFIMSAVTTARVGQPDSASSVITSVMKNFSVNMWGFIVLRFNSLRFETTDGRKPDVTVDMHPTDAVMFGGPLNFVNKLREFIPSDGFSDPSAIQVTPSGISAGYSLTLPSAQVGVFALSGLSIGARFELPFDTQPMSVAFNFAKREDPFSLTVSLLGGGGFLMIGVGADGVREIEAALEAQARLSIDLGVASGSVEISAGIYFHWLTAAEGDGAVELSGYVRLHGELNVMCIVSMSLTFNLQLGIQKRDDMLVVFGEATLTVEVEVLVFSGEVTVRCRREFKNPEADPTFAQLVTGLPTWESYCLAFAAE
ncbi:hypothetical protein [Gemmatimonas sp.]|uniref:hypothetical protein n=1 Tax=Gemmatimonas sp. TaxID=1962908 RepID=UPI00286E6232|nr:hypothetical protein [Gemmatimonas sp.]